MSEEEGGHFDCLLEFECRKAYGPIQSLGNIGLMNTKTNSVLQGPWNMQESTIYKTEVGLQCLQTPY